MSTSSASGRPELTVISSPSRSSPRTAVWQLAGCASPGAVPSSGTRCSRHGVPPSRIIQTAVPSAAGATLYALPSGFDQA